MSSPEKALDKALASAPSAVVDALGGAPVAVPGARPGQRPAPADGAAVPHAPAASAERLANPLFDAPDPRIGKARKSVVSLRNAFGTVAAGMQAALALAEISATTFGDAYQAAAKLEGFDLKAAEKVLAEFQAFLDRHKPKAPSAS
jgi:hypothetical protein